MRLCGLGPLTVHAGNAAHAVPARRDRALLAVLMLSANQVVDPSSLVDAVWGDDPPSTARAQVHNCVSRLRRLLPSGTLRTAPGGYLLSVRRDELDLLEFEALVAGARTDATRGRGADAVDGYRAALGLWRGAAFTGVDSAVVRAAAATWEELRSQVWEECVEAELARGRSAELVGELTRMVHEYPTRERLRGQLMLALYRAGRRADALTVFRDTRRMFADELGVEPGPDLVDLHQRMLRAEEPPAAPGAPAPAGPRARQQSPGHPTAEAPRCLPRDVADFVGREGVLALLLDAVPAAGTAGPSVVLAVDGMPGVGKTALVLRLAHLVADRYPDGALHLDLHGHSEHAPLDPAAALDVLLRQLDVPGERIPDSLDGRIARWRSELADRRVLLVLDNAAGSEQVTPLLPGTDGCLTLITSRRRLVGLDGVRPLSLDVLTGDEAVALQRRIVGDRVDADPASAAEVARLCGYLALAIRLAAARLAHRPTWTVADLLARLGSARPLTELAVEGRGPGAAFALSYQNLGEPEQRMFRLLGLHPGVEFDVRAAAALADLELDGAAVTVDRLVDAHLLQEPSAGRYRLHDLLRDYARGLTETQERPEGRRAALERLLDWYLHGAVAGAGQVELIRFDYGLRSPSRYPTGSVDASTALAWYDRERANLMAAVRLAGELDLGDVAWRLARATSRYLYIGGYSDDLVAANTTAMAAARRSGDREGEAAARNFRAAGYYRQGRFLEASEDLGFVLGHVRDVGDPRREANALYQAASVAHGMSQFQASLAYLHDALRVNQELGDEVGIALCHVAMGDLLRYLGRPDEALRYCGLAYTTGERTGLDFLTAIADAHAGAIELGLGHLDEAQARLERAAAAKQETGNRIGEAEVTVHLAELHRRRGNLGTAVVHHTRALDMTSGGTDRWGECIGRNSFGTTLRLAGDAAAAYDQYRQALALALEIRNRHEEGKALAGLGELAAAGDRVEAVRLWREALKIFEELGVPERHALATRLDEDG